MARNTIDFGIDLGTTNSEIGVVDRGQVHIIRNGFRDEITPSTVRIDRKGSIIVGRLAFNQRVDDRENTQTQFKRLMGSQQILTFASSGRQLTPEELSAEVLKSLRQDVLREMGEEISAAVITVPALFEIPQCDATRRAAELAGITCSPLLQEPIAAALAYGFQAESLDGFLMVYDLGGGTFDASLIRSLEGRLRVIDHAGDNFLGGKDFDEKLLDFFIKTLRSDFGLRQLDPNSDRKAFAKLLAEAENAKIQLSNNATAYVSITDLGRGLEDFEASFEVTRSQYENLIDPYVRRTVEILNHILGANHLSKDAVNRIILVGGPTLTPHVRSAVEAALGVKPEFRVDPMTIVARGAALFASSQRTPQVKNEKLAKGTLRLKLAYTPVSQDMETDVAGKIEGLEGYPEVRIEISRNDGGWNSGQLRLTGTAFMASVSLNNRSVNDFHIKALDRTGNAILIEPDRFTITHGPMVEDAPLSLSILLGLSDNTAHLLIRKGTTVPCQGRSKSGEIVTAHEVAKGETKDVLNIPLLQGENDRSDRNKEIGTLRITGTNISRNLPAGSEIEIVVDVDRDFKAKVVAFIPILNQSFELIFGNTVAPKPRTEDMQADFDAEKERLSRLAKGQIANPAGSDERSLSLLGVRVTDLEEQLGRAKEKDPDAAEKARRGIEELKAQIDLIEESQKWPILLHRLEEAKQFASEATQSSNQIKDSDRLQRILIEVGSAVERKDSQRLEKIISSLESLAWEIWARQDDFWVTSFQNVAKYSDRFIDKQRGSSLIEEGSLAIERSDFASLRSIVRELWSLVPDSEETTKERTLVPSSLRKKTMGYL
ncbi:MAG TPA: Hsp70 family protein [Candidatus Acidoferrales bacterium]|jgi:molecular chaperone DnaK|nr:Hsp70 family protein [Candidatus Acidoferrales bacterium]